MERLDSGSAVPPHLRGAIVALGNFDGFHLGHQAVAGRAIDWARSEGRPAIIATFDPHPVRHFFPDLPPFRLTTLEQRQRLFIAAGADAMLVFHFDDRLAGTTAEAFVRALIEDYGAAAVVTGMDFTFGKGRSGNIDLLMREGAKLGLRTESVAPVALDGEIVSSSRIRDALQAGDCDEAARLMTRPFAVEGVVQHGDKVGSDIGYPTANIDMGKYLRPAYGVYAVRGRLPDGRVLDGVANLGIRPMFQPPKELLEPYFFDFGENLYGQMVEIEFIHFLRPEATFASMEDLTAQIARDCDDARRILAATPRLP
ncbi:bifunctional riboflavin kinase/FAD synthetase [Rhizorhapis suberifaciens]|uniref:Riboflavin biosynthesis protein n=1 Tax=Rhizorhapis suberifaciens TaxID=13656 RepID=A0A840HVC2_9SPHN|nr:bifunctional riboflavin kinase/FAD synthetase [Rhizorhapis suberifaciens]MBB4641394.1 riboflavin kinase/FMN adenylyltransferase [Rhizorhapis suberifaciens]